MPKYFWLPAGYVGYNSLFDHWSRQPGFFPLCSCWLAGVEILASIVRIPAFRRRGDAVLADTGGYGPRVGRRQRGIRCMELYLMRVLWQDFDQTGQRYSATDRVTESTNINTPCCAN